MGLVVWGGWMGGDWEWWAVGCVMWDGGVMWFAVWGCVGMLVGGVGLGAVGFVGWWGVVTCGGVE